MPVTVFLYRKASESCISRPLGITPRDYTAKLVTVRCVLVCFLLLGIAFSAVIQFWFKLGEASVFPELKPLVQRCLRESCFCFCPSLSPSPRVTIVIGPEPQLPLTHSQAASKSTHLFFQYWNGFY